MRNKQHRSQVWHLLLAACIGLSVSTAYAAEAFRLTKDGKTDVAIVVPEKASERTLAAANDLSAYLEKITGASFPVQHTAAARAVYLGTNENVKEFPFSDSFKNHAFTRDAYHLYSTSNAFYIIGDADFGVQNGVWDFLYSLGYRQ